MASDIYELAVFSFYLIFLSFNSSLVSYFGYVLLLFVPYLIMFYRILPHTLSPSFWYSGAYALVLAYATRARGPLAGVWGSLPLSSRTYVIMYYLYIV